MKKKLADRLTITKAQIFLRCDICNARDIISNSYGSGAIMIGADILLCRFCIYSLFMLSKKTKSIKTMTQKELKNTLNENILTLMQKRLIDEIIINKFNKNYNFGRGYSINDVCILSGLEKKIVKKRFFSNKNPNNTKDLINRITYIF